ncbi:MAG: alpha/beta hydrolase [Myxococcales bacterium]|nr:alpha/beta hydrolase [Myxococcales bacterium]
MRLAPEGVDSKTAIVFSHPIGGGAFLPLVNALAHAGVHVVYCNPRYRGNDTALIMEKCVLDLGACIKDLREKKGYERILLGGWSGGGSLSLFYQDQAEHPTIRETPAGDPADLVAAELVPADGILLLAAHVSRSMTLTEWIDPSVTDETKPFDRDPSLNLYDRANPNQPPYSDGFQARYAEAQIARNRRITAWVKETLAALKADPDAAPERAFCVHGTMAAPCFLDPAIDPSDREPGLCYLGDPKVVNDGPVGLARFTTLRSWLSQWSYDDSRADGLGNASRISCPVLAINNTADLACTPSHAQRLFDAVGHDDKELHQVKGADHYYLQRADLLPEAVGLVQDWISRKGF